MRAKLTGTDAYLEQWRRMDAGIVGDDLETEADQATAEIESQFTPEYLRAYVAAAGFAPEE